MKIQKRLAILLIAIATCVLCIFSMTACDECTHEYGDELTVITEATCHTPGSAYKTCTLCGEETVVEITKPHSFGEYVYDENAGCVTSGTKTAVCQNDGCNKTTVKIVEPKGHTFTTYVPVPATCTAPSAEVSYCDVCGAESERREVADATPAIDHDFNGGETCIRCGAIAEGLTLVNTYNIDGVTVTIYDTGVLQEGSTNKRNKYVLVVSGEGSTPSFEKVSGSNVPWYEHRYFITTVKINEGITAIGTNSFANLSRIDTVILPEGLLEIGPLAFNKSTYDKTPMSITIPASVTKIADSAFEKAEGISSVIFAEGSVLDSIGASAFNDCGLLAEINLPDSLTTVGDLAFNNCKALTSVSIGANLSDLAQNAFNGSGITVTEYEGAKYLTSGENIYAFLLAAANTNITACKIHKDTQTISLNAFENCTKLAEISVEADNAVYTSVDNCVVRTADSVLVLGISTSVIPTDGSVVAIAHKAFNGIAGIEELTIPSAIHYVDSGAFTNCTGIKKITVEEGVSLIGPAAFDGCSAVKEITLPFIGAGSAYPEYATFAWIFGGAEKIPATLVKVTLVGVSEIPASAFMNCTTVKEIHIPASVEAIGMSAFLGCTSLSKVYVEDLDSWSNIDFMDYYSSPLYLAKNLYVGGELVTDLVIPEGTTDINYAAFAGANISSVSLPSTLVNIGEAAFLGCTKITEVVLSDSVETLGAYAFSGCTNLESVTLSASLRKINAYTFISCESLTEISIPKSVTTIDVTAFTSCRMLARVDVASGNTVYKSVDGVLVLISDGSTVFTPAAHVPTVEEE